MITVRFRTKEGTLLESDSICVAGMSNIARDVNEGKASGKQSVDIYVPGIDHDTMKLVLRFANHINERASIADDIYNELDTLKKRAKLFNAIVKLEYIQMMDALFERMIVDIRKMPGVQELCRYDRQLHPTSLEFVEVENSNYYDVIARLMFGNMNTYSCSEQRELHITFARLRSRYNI